MRMLRTAALVGAIALSAAACGGASDNNGNSGPSGGSGNSPTPYQTVALTPPGKGNLASATWSLYAEPQSLDYLYAYDYPPNTVLANVCEQLLRITPDFKVAPGLAEKYDHPDPLTWVYTMRQGVKFHDGTTMTADDAVASIKRHMDPANGSAWSTVFRDVTSVEKTGPMQVTIKTSKPDVLINEQLAASPGTVESAAYLEKAGKNYGNPSGKVNCTGPYSLDSWNTGDSMNLKKFPDYWDKSLTPKIDNVKLVFIQDPSARVNALMSGEVDGGYMLPTNSYEKMGSSGNGKLYFGANSGGYNAAVTNLQGPLGDVRVRKALSMAIDRKGIVNAALNGYGKPAKSMLIPDAFGIAPEKGKTAAAALPELTQDVAGAKKLMADTGAAGKKIVIATTNLGPELSVSANAIQQAGKDIGLNVELKTIAPDAYTALFTDPSTRDGIDIIVTNSYDMTPDPMEMLQTLRTGDFGNYGKWSNPEYDALVDQALATTDDNARADIALKLQDILLREMPGIPLFESPYSIYMSKKITGATPTMAMMSYPWAAQLGSAS
ncbi:ABC transporter substrate-binding protein [Uniformispora flossi]|uniref:ABC transporter substrate-binding protein n=1 Tax=Uniformispora flossi TaxID=3390723 RepID=UPI003C2ED7A7